ncbi:DNA repair exonuclease [Sporolactobacillus sp. CQH2019]|uniref:metallophosphoesterase family protein n=1 Tax=Sporolactobacillus sp. CQH2019 TaxID=3023512 RepID=UPI002368AB37|nr:DNA repair exonuclease [Sporolactobacillus sp. CQH2019]MDD9149425.1 DNA repair exonuclease [Sporolactobacillus sp. CQH2019]
MIRFIHAADLHLDRPFEGLSELPAPLHARVKTSTFTALARLIDRTLAEKADFLIIAGDIFDDSHRSLKAQKRFIQAMERLQAAGIEAFLVFGNHDHLDDPWNRLDFPENVHVFPAFPTMIPYRTRDGRLVHLYGFSYAQRGVTEDMAAKYVRKDGADYQIGILHGAERTAAGDDRYAPFAIGELAEKAFDYWALGHIHKRQQLSPPLPIWYPGDIQGLSVKETGEKGALLVELDEQGSRVRFIPTADILWKRQEIVLKGPVTAENLGKAIDRAKEEVRSGQYGVFLTTDFSFSDTDQDRDELSDLIQEFTEAMNDGEEERNDFVWLNPGEMRVGTDWNREELLRSPHFIGDLFRLIETNGAMEEAAALLYSHHAGRRFLSPPTDEEKEKIKREAERLLVERLLPDVRRKN